MAESKSTDITNFGYLVMIMFFCILLAVSKMRDMSMPWKYIFHSHTVHNIMIVLYDDFHVICQHCL